ncbi:MAG: TonB-dependent receptor [Ignavibacteriaceae bacterium]|nr:TonB-dependent receptor [Ignavibacteriaceae bacterium]
MRVSVILTFLLITGIIFPQEESFTLTGLTIDGITHEIVGNVMIIINGDTDTLFSGSDGEFFIDNGHRRTIRLSFFSEGFYPYEETIRFERVKSEQRIIHLSPRFLQTLPVIISGRPTGSALNDYYNLSASLSGKELNKEIGLTLAATIKNEAGVAIRSMGPAPARPVIRGLGGDRVLLSQDGFKTVDLSSTSADHAVTLEPFTIEKVEILRGPRVLTKSLTAFGGLINTIRNDIPVKKPKHIFISSGMYYESANNGFLGSVNIKAPFHSFAAVGDFTGRLARDLRTPVGIINNTNLDNHSFSLGGSYFFDKAYIGGNIREYNSGYGVPGGFIGAHPNGIDISLFRRENNLRLMTPLNFSFFNHLSLSLSRNYFRQAEFETESIIGSEFSIHNLAFGLEAVSGEAEVEGKRILGVSAERSDFKIGGYVFTAPTISNEFALYYFDQTNVDEFNFEYAVRYTHKNYNPSRANISSREEFIKRRIFNSVSWSFTTLYSLSQEFAIGVNFSQSARIPSVEELYTEGPHLAAYSYEIGNPDLTLEKSFGKEIMLMHRGESNILTLTLYHNQFQQFITPRNTGRINYAKLLPIYQVTGNDAVLYGFEFENTFQIFQAYSLSTTISYTEGYFNHSGYPVPAIPPFTLNTNLQYNYLNHMIGIRLEGAMKQTRIDEFEIPTPGYIIAGINYQTNFQIYGYVNVLVLNLENILDQEYRNHLSRLRVILPEAGRNFKVVYKIYI